MPPQPYEGPATFHVDGLVYRIPLLRLELQERATSGGMPDTLPHPVVIVLERGELTRDATKKGQLRLSNRQELSAWWTGLRFEL